MDKCIETKEFKQKFLRMASYIDCLLRCSDEQKETLLGFIQRLSEYMPWYENDDFDAPDTNAGKWILMWQYCKDLNDIDMAIAVQDKNWKGLENLHQILSITYDTNYRCYVVFWIARYKEDEYG